MNLPASSVYVVNDSKGQNERSNLLIQKHSGGLVDKLHVCDAPNSDKANMIRMVVNFEPTNP